MRLGPRPRPGLLTSLGTCYSGILSRCGASRMALVERQACFGGFATASAVCVWHSPMVSVLERQIVGGLRIELIDRIKRCSGACEYRAS